MQRAATHSHLTAFAVVVAGSLAALAPSGAHAICAAPVTCICEEWPTAHIVRGSVRSVTGAVSQIEVKEVLAGAGVDPVTAGDIIAGELAEPMTCGLSLGSFAVGDEVLALWQGAFPDPLECPEIHDCAEGRCAAFADVPAMADKELACHSECVEEVRDVCPAKPPRLVLLPWAPLLDLGDGRTLPWNAAGVLANRNQCNDALAGPSPPCNDNPSVGVDEGCSVGRVGSSASDRGVSLGVWFLGIAFVYLSGRRSRRVPR